MSLMEKMLKSGNIKSAAILSKSAFFNVKDSVLTNLPVLNLAFSGTLDGGFLPGLTVIAGASKTFKTMISLYCMKAYLDKYPDAIAILYDSEFGVTPDYLASFKIDTSRVLHIPIENVEQLKFDISQRLEEIDKKDKVFIMIDSIGNLASKKEALDAINENSAADMSRAKSIKSLFRIITPILTTKNIPCIAINHIYQTQEIYSKAVVSGGCVVAGTEIQTPTGLKKVEDFNVGEKVITLSGEQIVTHIWNPDTLEDGMPECYELTFEDGYVVTVSDKHKFLVDGKWVEAKDLTIGIDCTVTKNILKLKLLQIKKVGRKRVYDLSISEVEHYILKNGLVTHNTGIYYSANTIFIISKAQEKDGTDLAGWKFTINIEKSRYVKEKSKLPFTVLYDDGIQKWSSLFDLAIESGHLVKPKMGWYAIVDMETGEIGEKSYREKSLINNNEFFEKLVKDESFKNYVEKKYKLSADTLNSTSNQLDETDDEDIDNSDEE